MQMLLLHRASVRWKEWPCLETKYEKEQVVWARRQHTTMKVEVGYQDYLGASKISFRWRTLSKRMTKLAFLRWEGLMYSRRQMWYISKDGFEFLILQIFLMAGLQVCHTTGNLILFWGPNPGLHVCYTGILETELYLQSQILYVWGVVC